ncbi:hypothetical protein [Mycobacterium sp. AT1]|uniref:hypothetical protein n=1 Tax=Mycobacterium sp. AT1 TaxID=1961706 RepID=UPI0009ADCF72|nr:hypothetical protein [Mycobacterium sp. AT1]OPX05570.1 hypothetical protein B1790_31495 [Mycobacterium sp. AT1]
MAMLFAAKTHRIAIGHGRHDASVAAAAALFDAWTETGNIATMVSWPADAASWLRPARHLAVEHPDACVIADTPAGTAQLTARLVECDGWSPARTFGFASVAGPELILLTGSSLVGMTGTTSDGGGWLIREDDLLVEDRRPKAVHR